jgi:hypothetical protein
VNKNSDADASRERIFMSSAISQIVVAGLDPAIHAAMPRMLTEGFAIRASAWTTGSSPVVTEESNRW